MADDNSVANSGGIAQFLEDDGGGFSATRLAFLIWVFGVLFVWIFEVVKGGTIQSLPPEVVTILGILMGGKVVQKFAETSGVKSQSTGAPASGAAPR